MKVSELMSLGAYHVGVDASLDEAMELMDTKGVRHLPVTDQGRVVGVLSERDLLEVTGWLPERAREVLEAPSGPVGEFMHSPVVTVSPQDTIVTAALRLIEWNIGCLPVLVDGTLVGILTESDVLKAYAAACAGDLVSVESDPCVESVMTTDVVSADHRTPAEEALDFCRAKNVRHLPVLDDGELVGIVSDRDLRLNIGRGQLEGTPIGELAPDGLITVPPETKLSRIAAVLVEEQISALPIVQSSQILGLVTSVDLLTHCSNAFAAMSGSA